MSRKGKENHAMPRLFYFWFLLHKQQQATPSHDGVDHVTHMNVQTG
jgi:hypothetical protein